MKKLTSLEKAKNAVKWMKALASGKYRKTTIVLRRDEADGGHSYCCLGVACEVFGIPPELSAYQEFANVIGIEGRLGDLRYPVLGREKLTSLNDSAFENDTTFDRIHSTIVDNFKSVFQPGVAKHLVKKGNAIAIGGAASKKPVVSTGAKRSAAKRGSSSAKTSPKKKKC
jgi:hypothetical protein